MTVAIRQVIAAMILAVLAILSACVSPGQSTTNQTTNSAPVPTSSISPTSSPTTITLPQIQSPPTTLGGPYQMPESLALSADTVAIGTVSQGSTPTEQGDSIYSYWTFNVEEYVLKPLPEEIITIQVWEIDGEIPIKGVHLRQGEHLLVFLKRQGSYFVFPGLLEGKFAIQNGQVSDALFAGSPSEPLDVAIARIKDAASTWAGESLTPDRETQVLNIALDDLAIKAFLAGREYETTGISPYLVDQVSGVIRYVIGMVVPKSYPSGFLAELTVVVNVTQNKVDDIALNPGWDFGLTVSDKNEAIAIALADATIQQVLQNRSYDIGMVSWGSWQEQHDGVTFFYILTEVRVFLNPRGTLDLDIFVDLNEKKVVKVFKE